MVCLDGTRFLSVYLDGSGFFKCVLRREPFLVLVFVLRREPFLSVCLNGTFFKCLFRR